MRYSELKKCPGCGAPITPPANPMVPQLLTCTFCQTQISVEPDLQAQAPQQPMPPYGPGPVVPFGQPAPFGQPPMHHPAVHAPHANILRTVLPFGMGLIIVIVAVVMQVVMRANRTAPSPGVMSARTFPLTCGMNERLEFDGKTVDMKGTLIVATHNCTVKLKNSRFKGTTIIRAEHNAEVELEGSTLEATANAIEAGYNAKVRITGSNVKSDATAIVSNHNPKVWITGKSAISGKDRGMILGVNAEVELDGSTVEGGVLGLTVENNAKLRMLEGAVVKGKLQGIKALYNADISLGPHCRVESQGTAVVAGMNSKLSVRNGTLQGNIAWELEQNAKVQLSSAKVVGTRMSPRQISLEEN
jgi:hypothetical protein